ncbi:dmX-like protein 2 [Tubulanus polymorphus]|uniref:dmX-like protein 2 n=1 Tax=Tubulanus polymorphus TaxID=672921 RepID=UPI003DA4F748
MNRHQVLTGATNNGEQCFAVGSVEGIHFTAYAAGCDIVILASDFQRVQIIPGATHGNIQVGCIDCCDDTGKVAASYRNKVCIFEPTPLLHHDSSHCLDFQWYQTGVITAAFDVATLSWNMNGSRLLTAGDVMQMWRCPETEDEDLPSGNVHFHLGEESNLLDWDCLWQCRTASPVKYVQFSADGLLFASVGYNDRLVKVWYEQKKALSSKVASTNTPRNDSMSHGFIYIAHPRAVSGFTWRKTSKYMPNGSVANMLMTSCNDGICRIWCETIVPDDGLIDLYRLDVASVQHPKYHTIRYRDRFLQRLKYVKQSIDNRHRRQSGQSSVSLVPPQLPSMYSLHDLHRCSVNANRLSPPLHFHLAASINPETDIPLLSHHGGSHTDSNFVVHWLNNKELQFTLEAEKLVQEMAKQDISDGLDVSMFDEISYPIPQRNGYEDFSENDSGEENIDYKNGSNLLVSDNDAVIEDSSSGSPNISVADTTVNKSFGNNLDGRIEKLLYEWHHNSDILFCVHPSDGSFLVWLVEWLDEYIPCSFRQASVSFSSRIPHCLPIYDAMTMSTSIKVYVNHINFDVKSGLKKDGYLNAELHFPENSMGRHSPDPSDNKIIPNVVMLTKHSNGSLNQWKITFADSSKFSMVLSVAHASRACGHRFRTNNAVCHPVLPLLLSTSHHNIPVNDQRSLSSLTCEISSSPCMGWCASTGFCSELILWRVEPVGPLSKSGGLMEVSRINSPEISAFANVAWLPTLLPSSTLGQYSNSPSALFVASDGKMLRIYQAVIDARMLLKQVARDPATLGQLHSASSTYGDSHATSPIFSECCDSSFNIVSDQSTARPGCIIELDAISDACQDWQHTQFLHIYQEKMIRVMAKNTTHSDGRAGPLEGFIDLRGITRFEEGFYLVVIEKMNNGSSVLHMWHLIISSYPSEWENSSDECQDEFGKLFDDSRNDVRLRIRTDKVCTQPLSLPDGVEVIKATEAAGHLSSASIYPACFAPYLFATACSDGCIRFWKCHVMESDGFDPKYEWFEWEMMIPSSDTSVVHIPGKPMTVSCAYSGRVAVAYRMGDVRSSSDDPDNKFVNLYVAIHECESTGGSQWNLEDTIELKNISIPDPKSEIDLRVIYGATGTSPDEPTSSRIPSLSQGKVHRSSSIPSLSTIYSVKKYIAEKGNKYGVLKQKHLIQLDWVPMEDGSHILTVGVGSKVMMYGQVSKEIAHAMQKGQQTQSRPMLQKSKSMTVKHASEEICWMKLRCIDLQTADGLPPLPMHVSWVRDGILVVGMDNEMHVYSQWRSHSEGYETISDNEENDKRSLTDFNLLSSSNATLTMAKKNSSFIGLKTSASSSSLLMLGITETSMKRKDKDREGIKKSSSNSDSTTSLGWIQDCGLFEAARIANPVLPQYHPKQLLELLNFGKIRRVKGILAHLVRCISGSGAITKSSNQNKTRRMSFSAKFSPTDAQLTEEVLDYIEINSIPPLPIYAILSADNDSFCQQDIKAASPYYHSTMAIGTDYSSLFNTPHDYSDAYQDRGDTEDDSVFEKTHKLLSSSSMNPNYFGPAQAHLLSRHLTHMQLPGLSSLDQMYLLALADTVSNTKSDFSDHFAPDRAVKNAESHKEQGHCISTFSKGTGGYAASGGVPSGTTDSMDDCGLRYMLAMHHYIYLMSTLPHSQRIQLQRYGMSSANIVWAFHSEAQEELLSIVPGFSKGEPVWNELKQFGIGWWVTNINVLRRCIEKVAKTAFNHKKDPLDAAIYFLAMKKKNLLWGLFRSIGDIKMMEFFKNNFAEDRWRRAALKNAFALLGKQRFEHAAAFFLLAGSVRDAVEVCLNKIEDIQLAIVIARLYENDLEESMPANLRRILREEVLGFNVNGETSSNKANTDPFLRSMCFWMLNDYQNALSTLLHTNTGQNCFLESGHEEEIQSYSSPNVFNFYVYLRSHPLLLRQNLAMSAQDKKKHVLLSGFTQGGHSSSLDQHVTYVDKITPLERRLYFTTAHSHFKAGCPMLALEVLTKLPDVICVEPTEVMNNTLLKSNSSNLITSGIITDTMLSSQHVKSTSKSKPDHALDIDWGKTSTSIHSMNIQHDTISSNIDIDDELTDSDNNSKPHSSIPVKSVDIMAQQLKYIACMKIVMEEMSTLATGFEVDGGQLRYQLYIWLEREMECLNNLCNFMQLEEMFKTDSENYGNSNTKSSSWDNTLSKPSLHEVIQAEKMDLEAKLDRIARRRLWLKANQQDLRTLLSYCSLQGAAGGGIASVRMELILLLQELQQEKTQQQLLSPLPFPTTLPMLSASIAPSKTVIADPIQHLKNLAHDLLNCIILFDSPPACGKLMQHVFTLRNLSAALSACIYQSLCDSDDFVVSLSGKDDVGMEGFTSTNVVYQEGFLMAGARRRGCCSAEVQITSLPAEWPGVSSLRVLLAREMDEEAPKLPVLMTESLIGVYMSLLIHALASYDANILYRLVAHPFNENMWSLLFGGGVKKCMPITKESGSSVVPPKDYMTKQRMKLHVKVFGPELVHGSKKEDEKPTYKELFVPPEISIINYFMTKVINPINPMNISDYDSDASIDSSEDEYEEHEFVTMPKRSTQNCNEHLDPNSYSWCLMRYAVIKFITNQIKKFLPMIGFEIADLPVSSPLLQAVVKTLERWEDILHLKLELFSGPPDDFIPGCLVDHDIDGPFTDKYKTMLDPNHSPFTTSHHTALPARRLWLHLVMQNELQDSFIRYIFKKRKNNSNDFIDGNADLSGETPDEPVKIIHKDLDAVTAFCVNQANLNSIALSTTKELIEMDIGLILNPPDWLENETEYDIEKMFNPLPVKDPEDFLVVTTPQDRLMMSSQNGANEPTPAAPGVIPAPNQHFSQTGRGGTVVKAISVHGITNSNFSKYVIDRSRRLLRMVVKRQAPGIRRMCAHPSLPYYITGSGDGCVRLWEWGHSQCVTVPRQPGTHPKVTKILFNAQGNKFGVADSEGFVCLWQVGLGVNMNKPFMSLKCHSKTMNDFAFVGSSSLLATAGQSNDNRNVALWDTLVPKRSSLIQAFTCHDQGCPTVLFAPQHHALISGGKKGEICIFDIRQRQLLQTFQAHESAVRCMTLGPNEEYFVTGSADGNVKIWGLTVHNVMAAFLNEHSKATIFRNIGSGVMELQLVPPHHLYSCGADGSLKVRKLTNSDNIVSSIY